MVFREADDVHMNPPDCRTRVDVNVKISQIISHVSWKVPMMWLMPLASMPTHGVTQPLGFTRFMSSKMTRLIELEFVG